MLIFLKNLNNWAYWLKENSPHFCHCVEMMHTCVLREKSLKLHKSSSCKSIVLITEHFLHECKKKPGIYLLLTLKVFFDILVLCKKTFYLPFHWAQSIDKISFVVWRFDLFYFQGRSKFRLKKQRLIIFLKI